MRGELPSGTVTFLFTDVEGSTRLLHELGTELYARTLEEHRTAVRAACERHSGVEVDTQGDAFFVAFPSAQQAVAAAKEAQQSLESGPIRVRMGLHTGTAQVTSEGYVGPDVHKGARIAAAGHGGQILISTETRALLDTETSDLGEHRLKDFDQPIAIFQLGAEQFPPLNTVSNTNLPRPTATFVGRQREVADIDALLRDGARLVSLTGPGGTGKTRLALETASGLVPKFKAGVFWVPLAAVRDAQSATQAIEQTIGAREGLAQHIGEREMLLLLDNLEQVVEVGPDLAALVETCPRLRILATTREKLHVRGEHEYPVLPLGADDAVELYSARAQADANDGVGDLCAALDNLPLAIELAAARSSVMTPAQMLERLSSRLDISTGARDADPRQRTLRAAIDWSYDLLPDSERTLFAQLSVFSGGCTLEAAEVVADAELDELQSLVDKSLLRHSEGRFWMLQSIHDYARERLAAAGDDRDSVRDQARSRHAGYYRGLADQQLALLSSGEPEEGVVAALDAEIDNLKTAVDYGLEAGDVELVRAITLALPIYWDVRGLAREGRAWLERAIALDGTRDRTRQRLFYHLAQVCYAQGDHTGATEAADEVAKLANELGGAIDRWTELRDKALDALDNGRLDEAEVHFRERLEVAMAIDNGVGISSCRINLALIDHRRERYEEAEGWLTENLRFVRSRGQARCEANTLAGLAATRINLSKPDDAADYALLAAVRSAQIQDQPLMAYCLDLMAASAAVRGDLPRAATLLGATEAAREQMGIEPDEDEILIRQMAENAMASQRAKLESDWLSGRGMDLAAAVELAKGSGEPLELLPD